MKLPRQNLRTPGPTPIPPEVIEEMSQPMIDHRGPEFLELITDTTQKLKQIFMTQNDLFILTASGTGSLEAALVNTLSPGDRVLGVSAGAFGDRFCDMASAYNADLKRINVEWGDAIDPELIRRELKTDPSIKAVIITHNETSTGVTHDLESIARMVKGEFGKLILVDAVSSLGCIPLPVDGWNCDMVGTASQKGFMIPPGLAFISVSPDAWVAQKTSKMPKFYFDLAEAKKYLANGQTPWTPNLSAIYGLRLALHNMLDEGIEAIFARHNSIAEYTRQAAIDLGLQLFCTDPKRASDSVTAIKIPENVDGSKLMSRMRIEENVVLAGGQGKLSGLIFRIGHLGWVCQEDIEEVFEALKRVLPKVGFNFR